MDNDKKDPQELHEKAAMLWRATKALDRQSERDEAAGRQRRRAQRGLMLAKKIESTRETHQAGHRTHKLRSLEWTAQAPMFLEEEVAVEPWAERKWPKRSRWPPLGATASHA